MIRYIFEFPDRKTLSFEVDEAGELSSVEDSGEPVPIWARLDIHRCEHCTLPQSDRAACPAAFCLRPVIEAFAGNFSYEGVYVRAELQGKEQRFHTSLPSAIRSIVGLLMALSACPVMRKMRPMAHFHVPFSTYEHTVYRAMGMYLIAQLLREQTGLEADWGMDGLIGLYRKIHVVNEQMAGRIRMAAEKDATVNALISLDIFTFSFDSQMKKKLEDWKPLFSAYMEEEPS